MADEQTTDEIISDGTTDATQGRPASLSGVVLLIIVFPVVAVMVGVWWYVNNGASEVEARAKIAELGAFITPGATDKPVHSINLSMVKDKEALDVIVEQLPAFRQLKNIDARGALLDDDHLKVIGQLDSLVGLTVTETKVTDKGMAYLTDLDNLINLTLYGVNVGNAGLAEIGKLRSVQILNIANTKISGDLSEIREMENLEWLVANGLTLSDRSAATLAALKNLSHLTIEGTKISDEAVQAILEKKPEIGLDR